MQTSKFLVFFTLLVCIISCKKKSYNCSKECNTTQELLFQTGFTGTELYKDTKDWYGLSGVDTSFNQVNSWEGFQDHDCIGDIKINYGDGEESQRWARIVPDPDNADNSVLSFRILEPNDKEPGKKKGRVQLDVNRNNCIREYKHSVSFRLHPDMQALEDWNQSFYWLSICEFWNNANWTNEKYPFRVTVNIVKPDKAVGTPLYFHAKADKYKGFGRWEVVWEQLSDSFEIPFGTWMELELYILEGNASSGKFEMNVTLHESETINLFSITNYTQHPKETCPDGFTEIHPLKFYTSEELVNYLKQHNKSLQVYWDNWKVWRNTKVN